MGQPRVHIPTDTYVHASRGLCGAVSIGHGEPDCKKCLEIQQFVINNAVDEWYVEAILPDNNWLRLTTAKTRDEAEEALQQILEDTGLPEYDIRVVGVIETAR